MLSTRFFAVGAISFWLFSGLLLAAEGGTVTLPYNANDNAGNQWIFYQGGQFQQQGNMPIFSQGAMLQINGNMPQGANNTASLDEKSGELIFENMPCGSITVTRRVLINKQDGWVRYVEILKNTTNQEAVANVVLNSNLNFGVQMASTLSDPRKQENALAWIAQTHGNGRTAVEMFNGKGAKTVMSVQYAPGNNGVQAMIAPSIPAGKEIALIHFHLTTNTIDAGQKFVLSMKENKVLASLPPAIRKLIINFRGGENFIGDYEILRGEILDVLELRSGDQLRGTLKEQGFKLQAFYGTVELPVENIIGMINSGEFRPRQLLVTKDGEVFGGQLEQAKITLELSSGQVAEIPLGQIARFGYRKRSGEPEEWTFEKPLVLMRSGDRIGVQVPESPIEVATRYGSLKLPSGSVAAIDFQGEEQRVHEITLTDGSRFAGLVSAESFEMKLGGGGPVQTVKFPAAALRRLQFSSPKADEIADDLPRLELGNGDLLVGALAGMLKLDTAFATLNLNAGEIKRLSHAGASPSDVQIVLWDETSVSGQLQEQILSCQLLSGLEIKVPVASVQEYLQPRPQASPLVAQIIKGLVLELNAEDWKKRDGAQEKLIHMGPIVIKTLKELRPAQSPEAQQRIDLILKQIEKEESRSKPKDTGVMAPPMMMPPGEVMDMAMPAMQQLAP